METSPTRRDAACAVCGRVLDWLSNADGSDGHWDHAEQDKPGIDHPPVPTSESSIKVRYRCDFCNLDTEPGDTTPAQLRSHLGQMYAMFRANRVGPAEPFHPQGEAGDAG